MKKFFLFALALFLLNYITTNSQLIKSEIRNIKFTNSGDTIVTKRTPGDWFYGPFGGVTASFYFGDFIFPANIIQEADVYEDSVKYDGNSYFPGIFLGLAGEYNQRHSLWCYGLRVGIMDYNKMEVKYQQGDTLKKEYLNQLKFDYISISPYTKLRFKNFVGTYWEGFYALGGLNFEIPIKATTTQIKAIYNPVRIEERSNYTFNEQLFKIGLQLGVGIDIFDANIEKGARTIFSPYLSASIGTKILKDFNSSLYSFNLKLGFSLLLGIDNKHYDTLKLIKNKEIKIETALIEKSPLNVDKIVLNDQKSSQIEPAFIEPEQQKDEGMAPSLEPAFPYYLRPDDNLDKIKIEINRKFIINFPNSEEDVDLSEKEIEFIHKIAEFMATNPESNAIIDGFNDNSGSSEKENQKISLKRAENAMEELLNVGIPEERIVVHGKGSVQNLAPNTTDEGRARNRRIEITLKKYKF